MADSGPDFADPGPDFADSGPELADSGPELADSVALPVHQRLVDELAQLLPQRVRTRRQ